MTGCTGKSLGGTTATSSKEVKKPDKILWYSNVGLDANQKYEEWNQEFKKKTGIDIDFTPMNNNDYKQNLELAFASKKAPDVFNLAGEDELPRYASQGALEDLSDLVKAKIIAQIVMGKSSVDDGLNDYSSEAKNLGIDDAIKEMNGRK